MGRVLVVDDDESTLELMNLVIKNLGHEIQVAASGEKAIELVQSFRPHVVLLDLGLPDKSGLEVTKEIRSLSGLDQTIIVAVTGHREEDLDFKFKEVGFDYHLTKPVGVSKLKDFFTKI